MIATSKSAVLSVALLIASPTLSNTLDRVVVYADRAQVTRTGQTICLRGQAELEFTGLPAGLDQRTLRAQVGKDAEVIGVSSRIVEVDRDRRDAQVQAMLDEIQKLEDQTRVLDDRLQTLQERRGQIDGYNDYMLTVLRGEVRAEKPDMNRFAQLLDKNRDERQGIAKTHTEIGIERRAIERQLDLLRRRVAHHQPGNIAQALNARVAVSCKAGARLDLQLSYVVPGATWQPEYDLRYFPKDSKKVGPGRVELTVGGVIQQATGEDWSQAEIVLSTARPRLGSEAPIPTALYVDGSEVGEQKVMVQATERRDAVAGPGQRAGREPEAAALEDRGQSFVLTLPGRVTVLADGRPYWFPVDVTSTPAEAKLVTVPRLRPHVFQLVQLHNPAAYPLMQGRVHVYRDGSFIGDTTTEYRAPGEPMEVSLGIDASFRTERIDLFEVDRDARFLARDKSMRRGYRIKVRNGAKQTYPVEVRESIPVSKDDNIRVTIDKNKTSKGYSLDPLRGFVTWTLRPPPATEQKIDLAYTIKLPQDWQVQ